MKRFRGGLVFKAHGLLYRSTPSSRVIKKKRSSVERRDARVVGKAGLRDCSQVDTLGVRYQSDNFWRAGGGSAVEGCDVTPAFLAR